MSGFNISKKDLEQLLESKKKELNDVKDMADKLVIVAEIGNIEGQLKAIENGFEDEESRKLFGTVGAMEKRSKFAADNKIVIPREYRNIPVELSDIKAQMWNTIKYDDFNHSNKNLEVLKGRLQDQVVKKLLDDNGNFRHNSLENCFGDKELLGDVQAIKLKKPEVEALEKQLKQKEEELNSKKEQGARLAIAAEIGDIRGRLRAINNGFEDEASLKLFGTVGAMYERSNLATELKTDIDHDYSYILGDLRDIKEKMWNTFKYDNYNHSIENLEALKGRLQKKVVNKFLDNGKFIKENMKNYFGDEKLLSGVEGIELEKKIVVKGKELKTNKVESSITYAELDKAASAAQHAGMKGDAYLKYIYLLREWVRLGQGKEVTRHFKGMITTTQLNLAPEEEAKLTPEQKRKRIRERQTDNLNFIKKVAEDLATESIRRFDKDVNRRAAAMKKAADGKFGEGGFTVSVNQGDIGIDKNKLDPYATSKSVSRQLALRKIHKEFLDNDEKPVAYEALKADLKIFDSMKAVQSLSNADTAIMNELKAGIELHRSRMQDRINRVEDVYKKPNNLVVNKLKDEVEYVAPEADTRKTSRFSQIKDFTAFFTVKHNMVENAQNFLDQIAATTDKPTVFSAHSNEYKEMYQSLRDVATLPDNASPVQVYRAIEKLRDKAAWYHAVMAPKMHRSGGAKRVEISENIKNICDLQLTKLEQAIDMESSEFKTDLANAEYMEFKDPQKSKKDGLLDVKKENKEELKEQLKKRSRDMIHKTMESIKDTLDRVTKHANSDKQPDEFKAMYKGVSDLMNVTAPTKDKDDQKAFDEKIPERLEKLEIAANAYIAKNKSFLNSDKEKVRVETAIDLAGFCKRTISYLDLSRTLGNAPEKDKSWDNTDVKAKAGTKKYDPTASFGELGELGWVTNASNAAGKYLGALETIKTRAKTLFDELDATLAGGGLKGRSDYFQKMHNALKTVKDIDFKNTSHTEILKNVKELEAAARDYYNKRKDGWHRSAGNKRLAVSEAILALNIKGFEKLDQELEASGCAMMDDTPEDIKKNISEMDDVNRNKNPEQELVKLRDARNNRDTGLKLKLIDAKNKNDSNASKVALKKCFENDNDTKIQTAKLQKKSLFGVREEYPQEAMDYMIDNGMFGEMYKATVKIEGSDKKDKSRKNGGRKTDHTAEIKTLEEEIKTLTAEHRTIQLEYMSEFYKKNATEYGRLKRTYENKKEGYEEALKIFEKESKAKQNNMKARDNESPIPVEVYNQEWKAHQEPKLAELDRYKNELIELEAQLKKLENVGSKSKLDESKKRLEAKEKKLENLKSEQVDPELVNIEPLMLLVHTKGVTYEGQKRLYNESVEALTKAKNDNDSVFLDKLSDVLDKGYALRYQMGVGLWTQQQENEEKKCLEDAKKHLKDNWESISIAYSKDQIIKMVTESKDAAEFSRIAARFDPERLDCKKFLENKKFGNEPLVVEGQLNEKALNSYRENLKVGVYNNMKKLQELKKNTNPENKTENCKEMETCVNNMLDFSAALLAVNEMKKRFRSITRWDDTVTIQSVINTNLKLRDLKGDEIEEGYFKYIRDSETFRKMVLQCDKDAKKAQEAQKSDDPFASVNILTEKILHDDPNNLENFIKEVNRRANSGDRFLDPADPDKALIISIDPKNLRLDISEPRPQVVKEINPNLPKKEKKKVIEKLEIRKQKLEKSAYGSYFKAGTDFGNYETHANIKSDQREEEFLDQMIDILCQKGRLYDTIKEIRILKANSKKTSSITYTNEDMDLEYKSTRDALRKISRAMKPEDALKCCHDGSIIEQIRIVKHEMPIHLDATHSSNPADTPLNEMAPEERDKRVNLTKQILSARCERIANYLDGIAMMLEENQAAKDENKKPKFNDREYESLVKEAVQNLAALAAIKIREFKMKKKNGEDFLKGEESTLDRMFNGGIREVVDENNKNAEPRLSSKCGLTHDFMRKYFFRQMMADCKTSVPDDPNGLKGLAELLHSAGQENDLVAERHKTIEKLNEKLGEKFGEKLGGTRRNSFNSYIKNAIDNFKKLRKDDVLDLKTPVDEPVRDANRTFDVAGVRITPRTSDDMIVIGKKHKAAKRNDNEDLKMLSEDKSFLELYAVKKCIDPKDEFKTSIIKGVLEAVNAEKDAREQLRTEQSKGVSPENIRKCQTTVSDRLDKVTKICDNAIKKLASKMSGIWGFRTMTYEKEVEALKKLRAHYDKHYNKDKRKELDDKVNRKIDSLREKSDNKSSLFKVAAEMIVCEKIISDPYESNERILDQLDPIAYRAKVDEVMKSEKFLKFTNEAGEDKLRKFIAAGKVMENYEAAPVPKKVPVVKEKNNEPAPAPQTVTVVNETNGSVPVTQAVSGVMKNNGSVPAPLKRVGKSK